MDIRVDTKSVQSAIEEMLREYGDVVYEATEAGLDAAEKVLVSALRDASPHKSGKFAKAWKSSGKKYKLQRYVGNATVVHGKKGDIPLSNILEYSSKHGKPFIARTYESNIDKMAAAVVAEIKKEA